MHNKIWAYKGLLVSEIAFMIEFNEPNKKIVDITKLHDNNVKFKTIANSPSNSIVVREWNFSTHQLLLSFLCKLVLFHYTKKGFEWITSLPMEI